MEFCHAFQNRVFLFLCACISGILFALVWRKYEQTVQLSLVHNHYSSKLKEPNYNQWLRNKGYIHQPLTEEVAKFSKNNYLLESEFLYKNISILCLVFVNSHNGADAVKQTWAKHCNIVTFFGKFIDKKIPVMKIPPYKSFEGFCYAFVHIWKKYKNQFHWILVVDDYTYAVIENLRYYVAALNSSQPYYLGHPVKEFSGFYNIGTAGIVLSHGSALLLSSVFQRATSCTENSPSWYFDQAVGKILQSFNVYPVDTRDRYSRGRFNPYSVETMLIPGSISLFSSYWRTSVYLSEQGMNCCSDYAITFHDTAPSKMYLLEFITHHLAVFRNSLQGLGNMPATPISQNPSRESNMIYAGEPFVHLVSSNTIAKKMKSKQKLKNKSIMDDIWNEIFGS